jgi:hypothetical protein
MNVLIALQHHVVGEPSWEPQAIVRMGRLAQENQGKPHKGNDRPVAMKEERECVIHGFACGFISAAIASTSLILKRMLTMEQPMSSLR